MNYFTYRGRSSKEFNLAVERYPTIPGAERDVTFIEIPGRSGNLTVDNGRYKNIEVTYEANFRARTDHTMQVYAMMIKAWLLESAKYEDLSDTYDPDYFKQAVFAGPVDIENILNRYGRLKLTFHCKPFKLRKSGMNVVCMENATGINNPEQFGSLPKFIVYGSGAATLHVNNTVMLLNNIDGYVELDTETENASKGIVGKNSDVNIPAYPELRPGVNTISWEGSITRVEVIPRWRTL